MVDIKVAKSSFTSLDKMHTTTLKAKSKLNDRREALRTLKKNQIQRWQVNFSSEGGLYGVWPRLSPNWTVPERESLGYGGEGPILVRTGALYSWFDMQNEAGKITANSIMWNFKAQSGADDGSYAVFHSEGYYNVLTGGMVPARKIWDVNDDDEEIAKIAMDHYIDDVIKRYYS